MSRTVRAQSTAKFLYTGEDKVSFGLGARAQSTDPEAGTYSRIYGYTCTIVSGASSGTKSYTQISEDTAEDLIRIDHLTEYSWYTLEFTAEGTDLTCTLYDEDGTTVVSETKSDDTYTTGYSGLVPYTSSEETAVYYVSEYTVTVL